MIGYDELEWRVKLPSGDVATVVLFQALWRAA